MAQVGITNTRCDMRSKLWFFRWQCNWLRPRPRNRLSWGVGGGYRVPSGLFPFHDPRDLPSGLYHPCEQRWQIQSCFSSQEEGSVQASIWSAILLVCEVWSLPCAQREGQGETLSVVGESCAEELGLNLALTSHCSRVPGLFFCKEG